MFEVFELISTWFDFCSLEYLKNYPQILLEKKKKKIPTQLMRNLEIYHNQISPLERAPCLQNISFVSIIILFSTIV